METNEPPFPEEYEPIDLPINETDSQRNPWAIPALVLGCVGLIPVLGLITGSLAIIFGCIGLAQIKSKKQTGKGMAVAGISIGTLGIFVTIAIYSSLFYMAKNVQKNVNFDESFTLLTKNNLTSIMGHLEKHKREFGEYPDDLKFLSDEGFVQKNDMYGNPYYYQRFEDTYDLFSLGKDGKLGTEDDIYP